MRWRGLIPCLLLVAAAPAFAQGGAAESSPLSSLERVAEARAAKKISQRFDPSFKKYSKRYFGSAFDWRYFKAQGFAESGLKPDATSWVGARGVMQLMPSTYQQIASHRPEFGAIDQPDWNIAAGILHDRDLWQLWTNIPEAERYHFMFASYNAGEGTIGRALAMAKATSSEPAWANIELIAPRVQRWRYSETLGYVRRIDSTYLRLTNPFTP
jgi:soluble lytic murein transglycosylase-like protein